MYFATDPSPSTASAGRPSMTSAVAVGMKRFVDDKPDEFSHFVHRQPEHVRSPER